MSLDKSTLEKDLIKIFLPKSVEKSEKDPVKSAEVQAKAIATAIEKYIKSGTVETSVTINLTGQTFGTSVGPATAVPGSIASGDGIGEIK